MNFKRMDDAMQNLWGALPLKSCTAPDDAVGLYREALAAIQDLKHQCLTDIVGAEFKPPLLGKEPVKLTIEPIDGKRVTCVGYITDFLGSQIEIGTFTVTVKLTSKLVKEPLGV